MSLEEDQGSFCLCFDLSILIGNDPRIGGQNLASDGIATCFIIHYSIAKWHFEVKSRVQLEISRPFSCASYNANTNVSFAWRLKPQFALIFVHS